MLAEDTYVAIDGFVPKPGQCKTTTLSKPQRKKVMRGCNTVGKQDEAMWSTLTGRPKLSATKKCLLAVTMFSNAFTQAIGQVTTFINPGPQGIQCDDSQISGINKTIEEQDPSLIYIHAPFVKDNEDSRGYDNLKSLANEQMKSGRTRIIADSRHTNRWIDLDPSLCRGDLAFHCNDEGIRNELGVGKETRQRESEMHR